MMEIMYITFTDTYQHIRTSFIPSLLYFKDDMFEIFIGKYLLVTHAVISEAWFLCLLICFVQPFLVSIAPIMTSLWWELCHHTRQSHHFTRGYNFACLYDFALVAFYNALGVENVLKYWILKITWGFENCF